MTEGVVEFNDWEKLDLRVAEIKEVEEIEGADKLYKLILDVGELGERVICAGIKEYYSKEDLKGKKIIYFANLKPRKMRGVESQGMLLAASKFSKDGEGSEQAQASSAKNIEREKEVVLISPEKDIEVGSRVG